jgi:hypothetical protein
MVSLPDKYWQQSVGVFHVKVYLKHLLIVVPPKFGSHPALQEAGKSAAYGVAVVGGGAVKLIFMGMGQGIGVPTSMGAPGRRRSVGSWELAAPPNTNTAPISTTRTIFFIIFSLLS